jgi:hypothetical protein
MELGEEVEALDPKAITLWKSILPERCLTMAGIRS